MSNISQRKLESVPKESSESGFLNTGNKIEEKQSICVYIHIYFSVYMYTHIIYLYNRQIPLKG